MSSFDRYTVEYGIYRTQVFRKPATLYHVPEKYKTYEMCLAAFVYDEVNSLQYVPEHHKTYEMCLTAVKACGTNVYFVPEEHLTDEIKVAAMEQNPFIKFEVLDDVLVEEPENPVGFGNLVGFGNPVGFLYQPDEYALHTEEEIIHRFERNDRINTMISCLSI